MALKTGDDTRFVSSVGSIATASRPRPTAMMAPCGGFRIAEKLSTGNIPRFETENDPPVNSWGFSLPSRARFANSRTSAPIVLSDLESASRTMGVINPFGVATATATSTALSAPFISGTRLSARLTAYITQSFTEAFTPRCFKSTRSFSTPNRETSDET